MSKIALEYYKSNKKITHISFFQWSNNIDSICEPDIRKHSRNIKFTRTKFNWYRWKEWTKPAKKEPGLVK